MAMRYATITSATPRAYQSPPLADRVAAYLPGNYVVAHVGDYVIGIAGTDVAGWTLTDYIIPRLASGLMWAIEVDGPTWEHD